MVTACVNGVLTEARRLPSLLINAGGLSFADPAINQGVRPVCLRPLIKRVVRREIICEVEMINAGDGS